MLNIVVSSGAYRELSKGTGLMVTRSIDDHVYAGNVVSVGVAVSTYGTGVSIATHLQMKEGENNNTNAVQVGFPFSYELGEFRSTGFRAKHGEIELFFSANYGMTFGDEGSFHLGGRYCLELGGTFQGRTFTEFQRNFRIYREIVNSMFKNVYGKERYPRINLRLEPTPMGNPKFRELSDLTMERFRIGPVGPKEVGGKREPGVATPSREYEFRNPNVNWEDIGGLYDQKNHMALIINRFLDPKSLLFFGIDPSEQGAYLLVGPTGCGKGMLAKAVATQIRQELGDKVKIYSPSYAQMTSVWRGGEAHQINSLFETAKKDISNGLRVMVFLDEFQPISQRHHGSSNPDEALDQLLVELDRFDYSRALFLAASAQPLYTFDPQMIRPGRFGTIIEVGIPNAEEARDILRVVTRKRRTLARRGNNPYLFEKGGIDYDKIVDQIEGFPSAHIVGLIDDAIQRKEEVHRHSGRFTPITTHYVLAGAQRRRELIEESTRRFAHLVATPR